MESHFKSCKYRIINCEFCGKEMVANLLDKHQENDCLKFIIKCKNCFESMTREDYNNVHTENICMKNQIKLLKNQIKQNENENNNEIFILKNEILELKDVIKELLKENLTNKGKSFKEDLNSNQKLEKELSYLQKKRKMEKEE